MISSNDQPTAESLIQSAENYLRSNTYYAEMKITSVRPKYERTMTLKSWSKGTKKGVILITSPAKEKGIVFLKLEDQVWNWMPALDRVIKMPPSMMGQSWMGTDFTNDDLIQQSSTIDDYDCKIVGEEKVEGVDCYRLELIPKEDAMVVWGKLEMWIEKGGTYIMKQHFYDEDLDLINTMQGYNVKTFGDKTIPSKMVMIPQDKNGHQTILEYMDMKLGMEIEDEFFTVQGIKNLD